MYRSANLLSLPSMSVLDDLPMHCYQILSNKQLQLNTKFPDSAGK